MTIQNQHKGNVLANWFDAAKEVGSFLYRKGLVALGMGALNFGTYAVTHDQYYLGLGVAWTGLAAFTYFNHRGQGPTPRGPGG